MALGGGFGLQFQPGIQNGNGNGQQRGRVQEPVQVLSTRLPKIFGAGSIAPAALLQAPGGMGQPAAKGNVVAQALAQLAGLPPGMSGPGLPSAPRDTSDPTRFWPIDPATGLKRPPQPGDVGPQLSGPGMPPPLPSPPPIFTPPPPRVTPGDQGQPPPIPMPLPGPQPEPIKQPESPVFNPPTIPGRPSFPRPIIEEGGPPAIKEPQFDEGLIRMLASGFFR